MTSTVNESTRNGVDTATLFATLNAVKAAPEAARFQFRARNQWLNGTHNRSTIDGFYGVGEERAHERTFHFDADHPAVLGIRLTEVHSTVSGDIDLNGILGLDPDIRNGYQNIAVRFTVKGDAPAEKLREIVEQSRARSAVFDVITNQVPVSIEVVTE